MRLTFEILETRRDEILVTKEEDYCGYLTRETKLLDRLEALDLFLEKLKPFQHEIHHQSREETTRSQLENTPSERR